MSEVADLVDANSVKPIAGILGLPDDQIRLFLMWFVQFPIGWFLHFCVRGTNTRHAVNLTMGFLGMTYFYGWDVIHVVLMSSVSWLLMNFLPRDKQQKYVCGYVFAYLSFSQIYRVIYFFGSYKLDITLNTMLLTCRLQALAFSYFDGG